jgi:hypothetical protein
MNMAMTMSMEGSVAAEAAGVGKQRRGMRMVGRRLASSSSSSSAFPLILMFEGR